MGRHEDLDGDKVMTDADRVVDQRDEHAHDDVGCDQAQEQPDRWIGVTRDPEALPIAPPDEYEPGFFDG